MDLVRIEDAPLWLGAHPGWGLRFSHLAGYLCPVEVEGERE